MIFQAMDAAGKDGAIKHVMSGVNPQGCQVDSFKSPSAEELDHDYLWRCLKRLPARGRIGIFNRSYYEEVLVLRVHEELLKKQKLPPALVTPKSGTSASKISAFERYLTRNGYVIRKFFLHVSNEEQKRRFPERLENPDKTGSSRLPTPRNGTLGRLHDAYEAMIRQRQTLCALVCRASRHKWFTRLIVAAAIVDALEALDLKFPEMTEAQKKQLGEARKALVGESSSQRFRPV